MRQNFDVDKFNEDKRAFDENTIGTAMECNADILGFYGYQEALWSHRVSALKLATEAKSAQKYIDYKNSGEKLTDTTVKSMVEADEEIVRLKSEQEVAKLEQKLYSMAINTLHEKGKMLISRGASLRSEMENLGIHTAQSPVKPRISREQRDELIKKIIDQNTD